MTTNQIDHEMRNLDTPTAAMKQQRREEADAFAAYRAEEDAKKFKVRDKFGFSRFPTMAEAVAFAATLTDAEIITL